MVLTVNPLDRCVKTPTTFGGFARFLRTLTGPFLKQLEKNEVFLCPATNILVTYDMTQFQQTPVRWRLWDWIMP